MLTASAEIQRTVRGVISWCETAWPKAGFQRIKNEWLDGKQETRSRNN